MERDPWAIPGIQPEVQIGVQDAEEDVPDDVYNEIISSDKWADQMGESSHFFKNIVDHGVVKEMGRRKNGKFVIPSRRYGVTAKDLEQYPFDRAPAIILRISQQILNRVLNSIPGNEMVRLCIEPRTLQYPI